MEIRITDGRASKSTRKQHYLIIYFLTMTVTFSMQKMPVVLTSRMKEWWDKLADLFMEQLDEGPPNERYLWQ